MFRSERTRPAHGRLSGLQTLLRIRSLVACIIGTLQSRFRERPGVNLPVIEKCLNHVSGSFSGIVGAYQRYNFEAEMPAALGVSRRRVDGSDPAENVVSLRGLMA
jgi:hypothetical protein